MAGYMISPVGANPKRVAAGGVTTISAEFRVATTGLYGTPGTSIQAAIYDSRGTNVQALTGMTAGATGQYTYKFQTTTAMIPGEYTIQVQCVDSGDTSRIRTNPGDSENFTVE